MNDTDPSTKEEPTADNGKVYSFINSTSQHI